MIFPYTQLLIINYLSLKYSTLIVEMTSYQVPMKKFRCEDIPIQHNWLCQIFPYEIFPYEIKIPKYPFWPTWPCIQVLMHVIIVCTSSTCTSCGSFSSVSSEDWYPKSGSGYAVSYAGLASYWEWRRSCDKTEMVYATVRNTLSLYCKNETQKLFIIRKKYENCTRFTYYICGA